MTTATVGPQMDEAFRASVGTLYTASLELFAQYVADEGDDDDRAALERTKPWDELDDVHKFAWATLIEPEMTKMLTSFIVLDLKRDELDMISAGFAALENHLAELDEQELGGEG